MKSEIRFYSIYLMYFPLIVTYSISKCLRMKAAAKLNILEVLGSFL